MTLALAENPITEDFSDREGRWIGYDAYDVGQRGALATQKHIDLTSFTQTTSDPEAALVLYANDAWETLSGATFSVGAQSDRNNWPGLSMTCVSGANQLRVNYVSPLDLQTDVDSASAISIACPDFPLSSLDLANSFIRIDSVRLGVTHQTSIPFSASTAGFANGDTELHFPLSLFSTAFLEHVISVRIDVQATAGCTFRMTAMRLLDPQWLYAPLDINTQSQRLIATPSVTGATGSSFTFPINTIPSSYVPNDFPIMLRTSRPPSVRDPRPVNATMQFCFNTGSKTRSNSIRLFFREFPEALVTQLDLDTEDQDQLDALGHQPDYTDGDVAAYSPRSQADLEGYTQGQLEGRTMADLERLPNYLFATWEEVQIQWGPGGDFVLIQDTEGNGYQFDNANGVSNGVFGLTANTLYAAIASLEDTTFRLKIYTLSADTDSLGNPVSELGTLVFDTGNVDEDGLFIRRRGRLGWYASLSDGDAYITEFRERNLTFAEYRSNPMRSITPVKGVQLFAACTPDEELFTGLAVGGVSGSVAADHTKSSSGRSWKLVNPGGLAGPIGAISNIFEIDDPSELRLSFAMNFPAASLSNPPIVQLIYAGVKPFEELDIGQDASSYTFNLPIIVPDVWQEFELELGPARDNLLSGNYVLAFIQQFGVSAGPTTWYLDKISAKRASVAWSARPEQADAWGHNNIGWTPFKNVYNGVNKGLVFPERGLTPQVRAQARRQAAIISRIQIVPKYAELGRLVWSDQANAPTASPTLTWSSSVTGRSAAFTSTATPASTNRIVLYYWSFGDGEIRVGQNVTHTFPQPGTYAVTITAVDDQGNRGTNSGTVTVT